jgi:hypothetical protein
VRRSTSRSSLTRDELSTDALRGVRALIRVEQDASAGPAPGVGEAAPSFLGTITRVGIGAVLLLMLFGAELRLNFGLRLNTIVTLGGMGSGRQVCSRKGERNPEKAKRFRK